MKQILSLFILSTFCNVIAAQIFPKELNAKWDFKDETNKVIVISYELPQFEDLRYLKITSKAYVDDVLIPMRSLRGDIGEAVKVGKERKIEWSWENDVVEIAGELRFEVTADNPNPETELVDEDDILSKPTIPIIKVLGLPVLAGGGLAITGIISLSGARSEWNDIVTADRTTEEYDRLNSKFKTGQLLVIGGGAIVAAGVIWYIKEKSAYNSYSSKFDVDSGIGELTQVDAFKPLPQSTVGLTIHYKF